MRPKFGHISKIPQWLSLVSIKGFSRALNTIKGISRLEIDCKDVILTEFVFEITVIVTILSQKLLNHRYE
jgi:hypothetical protein